MKQIWPNYSYSPATNVLTLTGLNIDRDQLLLVTAADRGRIMYNFADSSVTASAFTSGANTALTLVATTAGLTTTAALVIYYDDQLPSTAVSISNFPATQTIEGTVTANVDQNSLVNAFQGYAESYSSQFPVGIDQAGFGDVPISGTVTANVQGVWEDNQTPSVRATGDGPPTYATGIVWDSGDGEALMVGKNYPLPISGAVTAGGLWYDGANYIPTSFKVAEEGELLAFSTLQPSTSRIGVVTIGAGTVTLGASTAQIGSVTASISNSVTIASFATSVTIANQQGTAVTTSNFTSTTASTVLASFNAGREVLTIFNEGAGNLHICAGATCTTIAYQVRLSAGDYYEVPLNQTSLTHSAVFATAGTARVTEVS